MADFLPPAVQKYIADVSQYVDPVQKAQRETEQFGREVEKAGIAADRGMAKAAEAARKAEVAQKAAAEAAQKLEKGEIKVEEASRLAAEAVQKLEHANLAEREASIAAANAADKQSDQYRQLARNAAMAAAAEQVAAAKATGDIRTHADSIRAATKAFPELKNSASNAFKEIERGSNRIDSFFKSLEQKVAGAGPLWIVPIANAIAHLPAIAAIAGGGITTVFGAAFATLGLIAQSKAQDIHNMYGALWKQMGADFKQITAPFHDTLIQIAITMHDTFGAIAPSLQKMFAQIAPALSGFVRELGRALRGLNPMFESLGRSFSVLLADLGPKMTPIINNFAQGLKSIFDAIAQNPQSFNDFLVNVSKLFKYLGEGIAILIRFKDEFDAFIHTLIPGINMIAQITGIIGGMGKVLDFLVPGLNLTSKSSKDLHGALSALAPESDKVSTGMAEVKRTADPVTAALTNQKATVDALKQAFDRLTGANISAVQAEINVQQAIDDTTAAIKANGHTLDLNTQKGRSNMGQIINLAHAFQDKLVAMKNDGATTGQLTNKAEQLRAKFISLVTQMTHNRKEAIDLANKFLGLRDAINRVPNNKNIKINENSMTVRQHIAALQRSITNLRGKTVTINYIERVHRTLQAERARAEGGIVERYANGGEARPSIPYGGRVSGQGTGTSDSIPVLVSNGEYVVNAKQTAKHLPLLEAINNGLMGFKKGGMPPAKLFDSGSGGPGKELGHGTAATFFGKYTKEYAASHAALAQLKAARKSALAAWSFRAGAGTGIGTAVQHTTVVVNVAGSVRSDRELEQIIQEMILQRNVRNPTSGVSLPSTRVGVF